MAQIPFLSDINLQGNDIQQVLKIIFNQLTTAPATPTVGTMYLDNNGKLKIYDGTSWYDFIKISSNDHVLDFDSSHDGLKAVIRLEASDNNLKLIGKNDHTISTIPFSSITTDIPTFTLSYTSQNNHINLLANNEIISYIDASSFILDGMLDKVVTANITSELENTALIRVNPLVDSSTMSNICVRKTSSDAGGRKAWVLIENSSVIYYTASATPDVDDTVYSASTGTTSIGTVAEYKSSGVDEGVYLVMVFNTDAGKVDIWVKLPITAYSAGNGISISSGTISLHDDAYWMTVTLTSNSEITTTILATQHGKGTEPIVTIFDNSYRKIEADTIIYSEDISDGSGGYKQRAGDVKIATKTYSDFIIHIRIQGFYSSQQHAAVSV